MDWITILIFAGFVLSGFCCGLAVGVPYGRKTAWDELIEQEFDEVLESEVIGE